MPTVYTEFPLSGGAKGRGMGGRGRATLRRSRKWKGVGTILPTQTKTKSLGLPGSISVPEESKGMCLGLGQGRRC